MRDSNIIGINEDSYPWPNAEGKVCRVQDIGTTGFRETGAGDNISHLNTGDKTGEGVCLKNLVVGA